MTLLLISRECLGRNSCAARGAQRSMLQTSRFNQRAALLSAWHLLDVTLRLCTSRLDREDPPYQSQKTVRLLCILGDVVRTALLLHVRSVLSTRIDLHFLLPQVLCSLAYPERGKLRRRSGPIWIHVLSGPKRIEKLVSTA